MPKIAMRPAARDALTIIAKGWVWIVGFVIVFGLAGLGISLVQKPIYEATSTLYITSGSNVVPSAFDAVKASEERVASYAQLVYSDAVLAPAIQAAGLDRSIASVKSAVRVSVNPQVVLLNLSARDANPEVAQRLANAVADSMSDAVARLEVPGAGGQPLSKLTVITTASVGAEPVSPNALINVLLAALAGAALSVLFILFRERLNNRVRDLDDVETALGTRVFATIPAGAATSGPVAAAFRELRSSLQAAQTAETPIRRIAVSSAKSSAAVDVVADRLASAFTNAAKRVLIIDVTDESGSADSAHTRANVGLVELVQGKVDSEAAVAVDDAGIARMGVGADASVVFEDLIASTAFIDVLDDLAMSFDYVIACTPPLVESAAARDLVAHMDGLLLVVEQQSSTVADLRQCARLVADSHGKLGGAVIVEGFKAPKS